MYSLFYKHNRFVNDIIITQYLSPQEAKNDKEALIDNLLEIRMNDNISHLIFPSENNEDEKQHMDLHLTPSHSDEKLFAMRRQCDTYLNAIFPPQPAPRDLLRARSRQTPREFAEENWNEEDCKRMLNRCEQIKGHREFKSKKDWVPNSIKMLSKLGPNVKLSAYIAIILSLICSEIITTINREHSIGVLLMLVMPYLRQ